MDWATEGWLSTYIDSDVCRICGMFRRGRGSRDDCRYDGYTRHDETKYKKDLISGTICAGGSLGTIIPPTVVVVVYASIVEQSIGDLFAGIVFPGLIMTVLFLGYILLRSYIFVDDAPIVELSPEERISISEKLRVSLVAIAPAVVLVTMVLGSILAGWRPHRSCWSRGAGCRPTCYSLRQNVP